MLEIFRALGRVRTEEPAEDAETRREIRGYVADQWANAENLRAAFDHHRAAFISGAARVAGARLAPPAAADQRTKSDIEDSEQSSS